MDCFKIFTALATIHLQNMTASSWNGNDNQFAYPNCVVDRMVLRNAVDIVCVCHVKHIGSGA